MRDVYLCDYFFCVIVRELGNKFMFFLCGYVKIFRVQGFINNLRVFEFNEEKLLSEFLIEEVCNLLKELNR